MPAGVGRDCHTPGELAGGQRVRVAVGERHPAGGQPLEPGHATQQRRLAGAVRPDQRGHAPGSQLDAGAGDDGVAAVADADVGSGHRGGVQRHVSGP
jgi:hypothetical protein